MATINVILQGRSNLFSKPGGDTAQIKDLRNGLIRKGLGVRISTELKPPLDVYDIVHLFNITRVHETYIQMANAKRQGTPVVCSTIYHDLREYNRKGRYGLGKLAFRIIRNDQRFEYVRGLFNILRDRRQIKSILRQWVAGYRNQQKAVLTCADKIIFGSESEKKMVFSRFHEVAHLIRYEIIKIGIPQPFQYSDACLFEERYRLKDFVMCVGRIEDLKNQLGLITAMKGLSIPLVLVGPLNLAHRRYGRAVLKEISKKDDFHFLGPLNRKMLGSAYAAARTHVLPSWFETTGLASLEAGLSGCSVVSTNRGYAADYLGDCAWYCDPSDFLSIRKATLTAFNSPIRSGLKEEAKNKFDLEEMLDRFVNLYHKLIPQNK